MRNIPFIKYSKILLTVSGTVTVTCFILLIIFGLKPGMEFTGGSLMELTFAQNRPVNSEVEALLKEKMKINNAVLQPTGDKALIIRTRFLDESEHQSLLKAVQDKFQTKDNQLTENRFETIGAAVSQQLKKRAIWAIIFVNLGIILYVAYAFRKVSRPVASWKYGALAIVALIHDVMLVIGVFAVLGRYLNVEVDIAFVVAILTVLGYSVNDTIVVYDRIRENLLRTRWEDFAEVVNNGLNQTLMRSINTTLTTLIPLFALYFLGGSTLHYFSLALIIGIASGAYSSIFIASPLLVVWERWRRR